MQIILYTTGCPNCLMLEKKMIEKGIEPTTIIRDLETMDKLGFKSVPQLEVDGQRMTFFEAYKWADKQEKSA